MNAILRGEIAVLAHCAVLETDRGAILLFAPPWRRKKRNEFMHQTVLRVEKPMDTDIFYGKDFKSCCFVRLRRSIIKSVNQEF